MKDAPTKGATLAIVPLSYPNFKDAPTKGATLAIVPLSYPNFSPTTYGSAFASTGEKNIGIEMI